jgi:dihydrofolate reductase
MTINIIVSVSENWAIGKNNKLLWKLSDDLKRFKELTNGYPIIMGQRTYESLPNGALPNRTNIVLTDDPDYSGKDIITSFGVYDSLDRARQLCGEDCEVFIIGGGMVYKQFIDIADYVYLTVVHTTINGDTHFPELIDEQWELLTSEYKEKDIKNEYNHTYKVYKRKY